MESLDNDEPIHHFEGKDLLHSCPSEPPTAKKSNSTSPNTHSPHATISPPVKQSLHKLLGLLKKISIFRASSQPSPSIINYYFIENRTIENNNNLSYNNAMKIISQVLNNYGTIQENNFYGKSEQHEEKTEVEDIPCEEVKPKHNETSVCRQQGMTTKDYSQSPLIPFMTYPQHAQYLLEWLHLNMDNQKNLREKLKAFRAVSEKGFFKGDISYEIFIAEFRYSISQSWYSRLMRDSNIYFDDELNLSIQSLNLNIFEKKLSINENKYE